MPKTCIYEIEYFLRYSECFDKAPKQVFVEAPEGLETRRGELEKLCRTKFPEEFKISFWRKIDVVKLV